MSNFFYQLASGNDVPVHQGVQCYVRPFPWTEEFFRGEERVHYYEIDEMTDAAFVRGRIEVWKAFFENLKVDKVE